MINYYRYHINRYSRDEDGTWNYGIFDTQINQWSVPFYWTNGLDNELQAICYELNQKNAAEQSA
jgi:hypothetical protein